MTGTGGEISGQKANRKSYGPKPGDPLGAFDRHTDDFYIEPSWSVRAFIEAENARGGFGSRSWDPACGSGTIPRELRSYQWQCHASDIVDRGFEDAKVHDFLGMASPAFQPVASIVSNPPYRVTQEFIERALKIATYKVAMLVQSKFPYSQRRHALFTTHPPARIYFLSDRPSMPPGDAYLAGEIKAVGGKMDFMWIVWDAAHAGPTEAHWLRRAR